MRYNIIVSPDSEMFRPFVNKVAHMGVPSDANVVYEARNLVLSYAPIEGELLNIKQFHKPRFANALIYTNLRKSKARRSWEYAHRLLDLGFLTPGPIAYIECIDGMKLRDSYYISRQISATEMRHVEDRADCDAILFALGREMARLAKAGVLMHDFTPGNVLFTADESAPDGYRFQYVDLNRSSFGVNEEKKFLDMFRVVDYAQEVKKLAESYADAMGLDRATTVIEAQKTHERFWRRLRRRKAIKRRLMPWRKKYRNSGS